jgi:hypothetical protein
MPHLQNILRCLWWLHVIVLEFVVGLWNQLGLVLGLKVLGLLNVLKELPCLLIHSH